MLNPWRVNLEYYEDENLHMAWSKYIVSGGSSLKLSAASGVLQSDERRFELDDQSKRSW